MKRNRLSIVLLSLFLVVLLGFAFSINGVSTNDLNFTFEKDIYYNSTNPDYYESFNVRNQTQFTGHYPATDSFENVENGAEPVGWTSSNGVGCTTTVINQLDGHYKVLNLNDSSGNYFEIDYEFPAQSTGVIEYWIQITEKTNLLYMIGNGVGGQSFYLGSSGSQWAFYTDVGGVGWTLVKPIDNNVWYHFKIDFNCTNDTFDWYINGVLEADNADFRNGNTDISFITTSSNAGQSGYNAYIDAIGYSWEIGHHFDISGETINSKDITWDGDSFWLTDYDTNEVDNYGSDGVYVDSFDVSGETTAPYGITWDGSSFWVVDPIFKEVYNYDSNGIYTGIHFDTSVEMTSSYGIAWNGSSFWITDSTLNEVYNYDSNGIYTGIHFDISVEMTTPRGITWDGSSFWIIDVADYNCYNYDSDGVYTGTYFESNPANTDPYGITWDGDLFWLSDFVTDEIYSYDLEGYYEIGDNMVSTVNQTGLLEVNRWEFKYKQWNDMVLTENGRDNVNTWTDIEGGAADEVNYQNGVIEILNSGDYNPGTGIEKDDFTITSNRINVSIGFELIDLTSIISSHFNVYLNSSDGSEVVRIYIDKDGDLGYYNSTDDKVVLDTGLLEGVFYEIDLLVNYYDGICILRYAADGSFVEIYMFPLKTTGKSGLKEVKAELECSTTGHQVDLEYIGVYDEGVSVSTEFAFQSITPDNLWYYYRNSLLEFNLNSDKFSIYVDIFPPLTSLERLTTLKAYTGINRVNVQQELSGDYSSNLQPIFYFQFKNLEFFDFSIEGVKLVESTNSYWLDFTYDNVNLQESYFYVDSSNRLRFSLIVNDNYTEYIQAIFDIQDISSENRSLMFKSNINGDSKGYLVAEYSDATSSTIEFPYTQTTTNIILPQTKSIKELIILITDNDLDDNDVCEGYITNIRLIYYPDVSTIITTLNLLGIIVPLIILIAPPLALNKKFGKGVVLPMFLLMSLVCVLTNLIPVWLFFIIAFASIGFLVMKNKVEVAF